MPRLKGVMQSFQHLMQTRAEHFQTEEKTVLTFYSKFTLKLFVL